jgi:hypothetical protein
MDCQRKAFSQQRAQHWLQVGAGRTRRCASFDVEALSIQPHRAAKDAACRDSIGEPNQLQHGVAAPIQTDSWGETSSRPGCGRTAADFRGREGRGWRWTLTGERTKECGGEQELTEMLHDCVDVSLDRGVQRPSWARRAFLLGLADRKVCHLIDPEFCQPRPNRTGGRRPPALQLRFARG